MALAAAFFLAPLALAFDQGMTYALVKWACATGSGNVLTGIAVIGVAMTAAGAMSGWATLFALRGADPNGGRRRDPRYFMAVVSIGLNALVALLILTAVIPRGVLSPCE
jgi:hypothetical protein